MAMAKSLEHDVPTIERIHAEHPKWVSARVAAEYTRATGRAITARLVRFYLAYDAIVPSSPAPPAEAVAPARTPRRDGPSPWEIAVACCRIQMERRRPGCPRRRASEARPPMELRPHRSRAPVSQDCGNDLGVSETEWRRWA